MNTFHKCIIWCKKVVHKWRHKLFNSFDPLMLHLNDMFGSYTLPFSILSKARDIIPKPPPYNTRLSFVFRDIIHSISNKISDRPWAESVDACSGSEMIFHRKCRKRKLRSKKELRPIFKRDYEKVEFEKVEKFWGNNPRSRQQMTSHLFYIFGLLSMSSQSSSHMDVTSFMDGPPYTLCYLCSLNFFFKKELALLSWDT